MAPLDYATLANAGLLEPIHWTLVVNIINNFIWLKKMRLYITLTSEKENYVIGLYK